jgi:hypothetical protein
MPVGWKQDRLNVESFLLESPASPYNSFYRKSISEHNDGFVSNEKWRNVVAELADQKDRTSYTLKVVDVALGELIGFAILNVHSSYQPVRKLEKHSFLNMAGDSRQVCKTNTTRARYRR